MYKILFLLFSFLSILFSTTLNIENNKQDFYTFNMELYEDKTKLLSLEEIKKQKFKSTKNSLSLGYSHSNFWFRFKIKNNTNESIKYILESTEVTAHELDFYLVSKDSIQKIETGMNRPNEKGLIEIKNPQFEIVLKASEEKAIYLRQYNLYPLFTTFRVLKENSIYENELLKNKYISFYLGAALILILYNFFIYVFTKSTPHILYVGYVLFFALWQAQTHAYYPFDYYESTQNYYMSGSLIPIWISFIVFFTISLLETKKMFPKIYKVLNIVACSLLLLAVYSWFDLHGAFFLISIIGTFLMPFLLYLGFKSYYSGNKVAILYIMAQLTFLIMSTIFSLMTEGYIEYNTLTRHGIVIGSFVEIFFFSLALGYKLKLLEDERFVLIHNSEQTLQKKVDEKTKELKEAYKQLEMLSVTDKLTGAFNRLGIDNKLNETFLNYERYKTPFGLIMLDVDNFKKINDKYGHPIGDYVLKTIAQILQENSRATDLVGRWGGEEFLIICSHTQIDGLYKLAENLRKEVEAYEFSHVNRVTISIGIAVVSKNDSQEILLSNVDQELYKAKRDGKNIVKGFNP